MLEELMVSETVLTLVATIAGLVWSALKATEWHTQLDAQREVRAVEVIEVAVEETYRTYVQALKAAREDGKLTQEERRAARQRAKQRAFQIARQDGVDLLFALGPHRVDLWIEKVVRCFKRAA
jgi:hypothetical protein